MESDSVLVRVHVTWDGWRSAEVRIDSLQQVHWRQPVRAPHELLHAFVSCADLVSGDVAHICDAASAPHQLLVCLLKKHVLPTAYVELTRRARLPDPAGAVARAHLTDSRAARFPAV